MKAKKLNESDRERLFAYVGREPEINLFFIGDIENYGLESETVSAYALIDGDEWDCVLLQYFDMYLVYSQKENFRVEAAADFLRERQVDSLSGKAEIVRQLQPYYPQMKLKETYMCRCNKAGMQTVSPGENQEKLRISGGNSEQAVSFGSNPGAKGPQMGTDLPECTVEIRLMTAEECTEIMGLYLEIEEFTFAHDDPEKAGKTLEADFASGELAVGVFENGTLAAIARTSGSNRSSAMLVGVATRPGFRKKGYATAAVAELCRRSFASGKEFLCLFYDNPEAGKIYHRIGFEEIGFYGMIK